MIMAEFSPAKEFRIEVKLDVCISESKRRTWFNDEQRKKERFQSLRKMKEAEFFNQFFQCVSVCILIIVYDRSSNVDWITFYGSLLLVGSYFFIFVMKVYDKERGCLWMKSSFIKSLWGGIRKLGHKWWCYLVICERRVFSWHFCVMQTSWRKSINALRFCCFKMIYFNWNWAWRFIHFRILRQELLNFFYSVCLKNPAINFWRIIRRVIKTLNYFTLTFVKFSIL